MNSSRKSKIQTIKNTKYTVQKDQTRLNHYSLVILRTFSIEFPGFNILWRKKGEIRVTGLSHLHFSAPCWKCLITNLKHDIKALQHHISWNKVQQVFRVQFVLCRIIPPFLGACNPTTSKALPWMLWPKTWNKNPFAPLYYILGGCQNEKCISYHSSSRIHTIHGTAAIMF